MTTNIQFEYDGDVIFNAQDLTCIPRVGEKIWLDKFECSGMFEVCSIMHYITPFPGGGVAHRTIHVEMKSIDH